MLILLFIFPDFLFEIHVFLTIVPSYGSRALTDQNLGELRLFKWILEKFEDLPLKPTNNQFSPKPCKDTKNPPELEIHE